MRKTYRMQAVIWSTLVAVLVVALSSLVGMNFREIGKSYVQSAEFQDEMRRYHENLGIAVLNPPNLEAEKKRIVVTKSEIEEHRNYFGTLSEQVGNIEEQYRERIADAEAGKSEKLKATLIEERDNKIDDIQKNFEDDAHVEAKIRAGKEKQLEEDVQQRIRDAKDQLHFPVSYTLTDSQTGETFTAGDMNVKRGYSETFNTEVGYLKVSPNYSYAYEAYEEDTYTWSNPFVDEVTTELAVSEHKADAALEPNQSQEVKRFEGEIVVPQTVFEEGWLADNAKRYEWRRIGLYILWALGALALGALLSIIRFKKEWVITSRIGARYEQLKLDLKAVLLLVSASMVWMLAGDNSGRYLGYLPYYSLESSIISGFMFMVLIILVWATVVQLVLFVERLKTEGALEQDIKDSYSVSFLFALQGMFLNRKIGVQMFILLIGFFLAGIGLFGVFAAPFLMLMYVPLALFIGLPFVYIFVRRTAYLNRIMVDTEAMANGKLHKEILIEGRSPLAEHAKNLNNLREGVRTSMSEQAKSERLKTELITNVSHDLRTPLTSIITYTDLLKNEDLSVEERTKYVDVLDKKSQRLKTLIEDLFEVSKMASGNLELHQQRVDLAQLLQQALAEHEEEISKSGLDFRVSSLDTPLIAYVDGQRWWRVLDNLIVNAIKYTLPGTRVYVTLRKVGNTAEFVVKNVTKYELGEDTDELFERFKRADTSRHTDGSGLGLAIAQSIVDMHNGDMKIEVDGDLFKVTVVVAAV